MSSTRFKIDEDLPLETAGVLRAAGFDAVSVLDQSMIGWSDDRLWSAIVAENRSLITADVGFADARRLVAAPGIGIVLLRLWPESRAGYLQLARDLIASFNLAECADCVITASHDAIRVHRVRPEPGSPT